MEQYERDIVIYIEPVYRFCVKRLNNRHDAEDLASEIMVHVLNGLQKYHIGSLDNWVWRIAHNRYARFINTRNKRSNVPLNVDIADDYDFIDEIVVTEEH